jgi:hypothetical protein
VLLYEPAATLNVGVATAPLMLYAADAITESENVDLVANALMVSEVETLIAVEYADDEVVGVVPSVV